nr:unnamed protein product [Digitaria exilis]
MPPSSPHPTRACCPSPPAAPPPLAMVDPVDLGNTARQEVEVLRQTAMRPAPTTKVRTSLHSGTMDGGVRKLRDDMDRQVIKDRENMDNILKAHREDIDRKVQIQRATTNLRIRENEVQPRIHLAYRRKRSHVAYRRKIIHLTYRRKRSHLTYRVRKVMPNYRMMEQWALETLSDHPEGTTRPWPRPRSAARATGKEAPATSRDEGDQQGGHDDGLRRERRVGQNKETPRGGPARRPRRLSPARTTGDDATATYTEAAAPRRRRRRRHGGEVCGGDGHGDERR